MKKSILIVIFTYIYIIGYSQNSIIFSVKDENSKETLIGANVAIKGTTKGASADENGQVKLQNIADGRQTFVASFIGYESHELILDFPQDNDKTMDFLLKATEDEIDEIIVEATRANRSILDIPTRIEALTEEIDEASTMDPSKIAHLLTHSTGIQVQTTGATSNTANVRIQGLDGKYTQILRDGFPIYGGFSGSLSITQIPPLDLRQVEYVKGSASTLYGGGAIAGLINLLSKDPRKEETQLHLNYSHIGARDANAYVSRMFGKFGTTMLANFNLHNAYDADSDGFSDLPELQKFNFNPKLYFYPNPTTKMYLGATLTRENRRGGDMTLLRNEDASANHFYKENNDIARTTTQFKIDKEFGEKRFLTFKNSFNIFDRTLTINEQAQQDAVKFAGQQVSSFNELSYQSVREKHNLTLGLNLITDKFEEQRLQNPTLRDESHTTTGFFVNHLWDVSKKIALESGLRSDYNTNSSSVSKDDGRFFVLPRVNALIKWTSKLGSRIGGGLGYRPATMFNQEAEISGFKGVKAIDFATVKSETSYGGNVDFSYKTPINDKASLSLNQLFFYSRIENPVVFQQSAFINASAPVFSKGFETQMKLFLGNFTWFVGYTYTDARQGFNDNKNVPLTPKHSIKGDILYVLPDKWRIGADYEYKSRQTLSDGRLTPQQFMAGLLIERTLSNFVVFLNLENFTDVRQTRFESLVAAPYQTPQYTEIYAPLDGFFANVGLKIKL